MGKKKVVLTGASGYVAGRMLPALRERYDLTLLDVKTTNREGEEVEGVQVVDLENPDRDAYRAHFQGADAVVHSGFKGTVDWQHTDYWKESDNVPDVLQCVPNVCRRGCETHCGDEFKSRVRFLRAVDLV